jgi:hypothetical protein
VKKKMGTRRDGTKRVSTQKTTPKPGAQQIHKEEMVEGGSSSRSIDRSVARRKKGRELRSKRRKKGKKKDKRERGFTHICSIFAS